ncbi:hypothetical protein IQ266_19975 [filamentous cyanobacterium LEGE 11480]|uniref:Secreted protein n=1 Tax=Romeriopsis navalis LEGE 11480 TaxID=2777977 RepID=A0A928VTZ3_9CYAN|nr:hypothetical protein [Romeriopsis navalis]MBE9032019.1 hypothetical protein [Romeriopsis navalis LEGE 11480]
MNYWQSTTVSTIVGLSCLMLSGMPAAQANTPRGDSGINVGSEAAPIGQPSNNSGGGNAGSSAPTASGGPAPVSPAGVQSQQAAQVAITAVTQSIQSFQTTGGSVQIQIEGGAVTISIDAPSVAAASPVAVGAGQVRLSVVIDNGEGAPQQRTFTMANAQTAKRVSATLAGVIQGLSSLKTSPARIEQGIAMVTQLGTVPQSEAIVPAQMASQMVVLLSLLDQLPAGELNAEQKDVLSDAINAYNDLVKRSSAEVIVVLAQQGEFQLIETQLRGLRAAVDAK